ncbi:hypothetical protein LTR62_000934 [Meristemomyces frigidus]|uniref:glucan 1,3-beta-glucosidase n=1 Tax=Meristemomyces frigidus TaxID=1508187 RepID=A0AAN7T8Y0_9PEZI|nr:hypothetical protein LTR62_000934 [Meristemomyces frigidus]
MFGSSTFAALAVSAIFASFATARPHQFHSRHARPSQGSPTIGGFAHPSGTGVPYPVSSSHISSNATANTNSSTTSKVRGVNLGGWLILEEWMYDDDSIFSGTDATDQWTFDSTPGAEAALHNHWDTYINETDFAWMAKAGFTHVRIPIGYWAYNNSNTPYITGADAILEKAIGWARQYGMWVMIDCHGSPGSQNGQMHSGHSGSVDWQTPDNLGLSIDVLNTIGSKYGAMKYADVVMGIEIVNEPSTNDGNDPEVTMTFAKNAYDTIKYVAANPDLYVITHDAWLGASKWSSLAQTLNSHTPSPRFALDLHLYQNQDTASKALDIHGHIAAACAWSQTEFLPPGSDLPIFVGEFAGTIDICANPNNSTDGGLSCTEESCQCTNIPMHSYVDSANTVATSLRDDLRRFWEAQVQTFEHSSMGWFVWSLKGPGLWSAENLVQFILQGDHLGTTKFPGICAQAGSPWE